MTNFQGNNYHPSAENETALKTCVASVAWHAIVKRKPRSLSVLLKCLSFAGLLIGWLGAFLLLRYGDANRKIGLSVIGVGLTDEEPNDSPRRTMEKKNQLREWAAFGIALLGSALQFVSSIRR
jgi:hypothetical protein